MAVPVVLPPEWTGVQYVDYDINNKHVVNAEANMKDVVGGDKFWDWVCVTSSTAPDFLGVVNNVLEVCNSGHMGLVCLLSEVAFNWLRARPPWLIN